MDNVIFGAEFDTTPFKKGAEELVAVLKQLKETQAELQAQAEALSSANKELQVSNEKLEQTTESLKDANKQLSTQNKELEKDVKFQQAELKKLDKDLLKVNQSTRQGQQEARDLARRKRELNAELKASSEAILKNNQTIQQNTAQMKLNRDGIAANTASIKQNTEAIKQNEVEQKKNNVTIKETEKGITNVGKSSDVATKAVKGLYGGLRTMANIIPGLGISGLILLLYELGEAAVKAFFDMEGALSNVERAAKLTNDIRLKAADTYGKERAQLDVLIAGLKDEAVSRKEKAEILTQLQQQFPGYFDNIKTEADLTTKLAEAYERASRGILAKASANAAEGLLSENISKRLKAETEFRENERKTGIAQSEAIVNESANFGRNSARVKETRELFKQINKERSEAFGEEMEELGKQNKFLIDRIVGYNKEIQALGGDAFGSPKTGGSKATPENVFQQKLAEFRQRLAAAQLQEFQSEPLIRQKFEEQLNKEFLEIGKLLKDKKLTGPQADILKGLLQQINEVDLARSLDEFRKKQADAMQKVNDTILQLSIDSANKRIANIRDEFERDKQAIEAGFSSTLQSLQRRLQDLQKGIDEEVKKGLLNPKQGQQKKGLLSLVFGELIDAAEVQKVNQQLELSFRIFQNTIRESQRTTEELLVGTDETTADRIRQLTEGYFAGTIPYKKYQEELTRITREQANIRNNIRLQELRSELEKVNQQLSGATDPSIRKKLEDQQRTIRGQIAGLQNQINQDGVKQDDEATQKRIQNLISYANAVQGVLQSVASFWNQVNQVEQAALDRSIAMQEKRVENAKEIAERGNAEYLEMERKRLDEMERKREENARRQIAINSALTMSQATVAAIGAIAQAVSTGSPLAAIGALAATIGAIGAAFAFVNSLQPPVANFYEGEEYVDNPNRPRGKDTIPARLNIGERVVTTDKNAAYWDTLTAIHNGTISPDVLNSFVNAYPNVSLPSFDYDRLSEATNGKLGFDSYEIAKELKETNEKLSLLIAATAGEKVNIRLDQDGFSLGMIKAIDYTNKLKKA